MTAEAVHRHRTAMVRHGLSQPMSLLVRHALIAPGVDVFDYGCGQGDDVRSLASAGVAATGWDPHFAADQAKNAASVVNLGFVLNVIEDEDERRRALAEAWALTERVLAVSTMIVGQVPTDGLRPFRDGYLTSRGTFQKFYQHAELGALITAVLGGEPVAAAPGIFFVFRRPEDEEEFLLTRRSHRRASTAAYSSGRTRRSVPSQPGVAERVSEVLEEIADFALRRGRMPHPDELTARSTEDLLRERVSFARALDTCRSAVLSREALESAAREHSEDLLVHTALGLLNRSRTAARPSAAMVRDVRALFGSQRELAERATAHLHQLADTDVVVGSMASAVAQGRGLLDERGRFLAHGDGLNALPGALRCYLGCAIHLSGEPEGEFVARLDPVRKRVSLFPLIDPKAEVPRVESVVGVDLGRGTVSVRNSPRLLVRKADLLGLGSRTKQRRREHEFRQSKGIAPDLVFLKSASQARR